MRFHLKQTKMAIFKKFYLNLRIFYNFIDVLRLIQRILLNFHEKISCFTQSALFIIKNDFFDD